MKSNFDMDSATLEMIKPAIDAELKANKTPDLTHITEELFLKVVEPILKIPKLAETQVYKVI